MIAAAALAFGSLALSPSAQEYYEEVRAGSPPTGGRIPIPNGSWYPALGPVSKWAYDWQGVTNSNNGCYGILLWALMDPAFVDRDELWAVEDGYEYLLGYYYDVPRDDPSPFSWEKWGLADGNLNGDQNAVAVFCPGFTPGSMQIKLSIEDKPLWWCYWDGKMPATGSPNQVWLYIYSSHLSRDEANQGMLNSPESGAAGANCNQAAHNAYDGTNPYLPVSCPWGENALHTYLYDSQGGAATNDVTQINFSGVRRGDVVRYTWWVPGYGPDHVETFADDGVDYVWGCNTANPIPNWNHASVAAWIVTYNSTHEPEDRHLLVLKQARYSCGEATREKWTTA